MSETELPASALLVLRAWREDGSLRVRVSSTPDVRAGAMAERVVAAPDDVLAAVRQWLDTVPD